MSSNAHALSSKRTGPSLRVLQRKKDKIKGSSIKGTLVTAGIVFALIATILFGVLMEQVILAQSAFELSGLRADMAKAEQHHEELLLDSARLDNTTRIERYARTRLGMTEPLPGSVQYVVADVRTGTPLAEATVDRGTSKHLRRQQPAIGAATASGGYEGSP